jgi:hypothetical protein
VIRVDRGAARIVEVSADRIVYTDDTGDRRELALTDAAARFAERHPWAAGTPYVAYRNLAGPPFQVTLPARPLLTFDFESAEAAYEQLVDPLRTGGWRTLDRD